MLLCRIPLARGDLPDDDERPAVLRVVSTCEGRVEAGKEVQVACNTFPSASKLTHLVLGVDSLSGVNLVDRHAA